MMEINKTESQSVLLEVKNLWVTYTQDFKKKLAVKDVSFSLSYGETLGIIGESGAGKSTLGWAILGMIKEPNEITGKILVNGRDVLKLSERELMKYRWSEVSMVFQTAMNSLNPVISIGSNFMRLLLDKGLSKTKIEAKEKIIDLFNIVNLRDPESLINKYPHELSGGMKQRIVLAMALSASPSVLIADEPTTALDTINQLIILELLKKAKEENKVKSVILISHDLSVHAFLDDRIIVMLHGEIVERGLREEILRENVPHHPYTESLNLSVTLNVNKVRESGTKNIRSSYTSEGCAFATLCPKAMEKCFNNKPDEIFVSDTHAIKCFLFG